MRLRALLFLPLALGGAAACASVWGFEDGVPAVDAGAESGAIVDTEVVPAEGAAGVVCVPSWPPEWQGPLVIAETTGAPAPEPPACPTGYAKPIDGHANATAGSCACACGAPTGMTCSTSATVAVYADETNCTNGTNQCGSLSVTTTCTAYPDAGCPAMNSFAKVTAPVAASGGSCAPTGPGVLSPPAWGAATRVCAPPFAVAGKCPADKVPTPQASPPYQTNYCIGLTGTAACPASYPKQRVYFTGESDTRSCQCSCETPAGAKCAVVVQGMDHDDCTGAAKATPTTAACVGMTNSSGIVLADAGVPTGGSCAPSSTITGTLQGVTPFTICCRH
jgi:hypothetical protein